MNPLIKFILGFSSIPDQAVEDLEKSWPGIQHVACAARELEPYLKQASPHIDALEPIFEKCYPIIRKVWPDVLDLLPVADEWINIVSKGNKNA